jgi:hypothetical protein
MNHVRTVGGVAHLLFNLRMPFQMRLPHPSRFLRRVGTTECNRLKSNPREDRFGIPTLSQRTRKDGAPSFVVASLTVDPFGASKNVRIEREAHALVVEFVASPRADIDRFMGAKAL